MRLVKSHRLMLLHAVLVVLLAGCGPTGREPLRVGAQPQPEPFAERPLPNRVLVEGEIDSPQLHSALQQLDERIARYPDDHEAALLKGLILFEARRYRRALRVLDELVRRVPNFHLAQMVRGDMLLSRAGGVTGMGYNPILNAIPDSRHVLVEDLRAEARKRLQAYLEGREGRRGRLPGQLLQLGSSVGSAVLVDKEMHRLYLFVNQGEGAAPRLLHDFYVSTGRATGDKRVRGDLRTPEGVYFVTRFIPDGRLPEKYGVGAFPINYPNELDRYRYKTGSGIWLHGLARRFYSRPPLDSEGCVVLSNPDLEQIMDLIAPGSTPVVIAERLEWLEPEQWELRRDEILAALQEWRRAWEEGDSRRYLASYAPDFHADGFDFDSWAEMKRRVLAQRGRRSISVDDVSLLAYGGMQEDGHEIAVADFRISYVQNGVRQQRRKRLYLGRELEHWHVLYESNVVERGSAPADTALRSSGPQRDGAVSGVSGYSSLPRIRFLPLSLAW